MAQPNYSAGPSALLTVATLTANAGSFVDIPADSDQIEVLVSNYDATLAVYARDTAATTQGGTKINAGETAVISTSAAVRIVNPGGSNVSIGVNRIKTP